MKTEPMSQQIEARKRLIAAPEYYALGAEQGTGKTWMALSDAEHQFREGRIQGALVVAPKGVHTNWVLREIPDHLEVDCVTDYWVSGAGVRHRRRVEKFLEDKDSGTLKVLALNIDAIKTKPGLELCRKFMRRFRSMLILDESHRIKSPSSKVGKKMVEVVGPLAVSRRILSGTLVADKPVDLFNQYEFLETGLLGTTSYRTFVSEYTELLPKEHPKIVEILANSRSPVAPQIAKRDVLGRPMYKKLDKLGKLLAPHTYRVLKSECMDLPEKIYTQLSFDLSPSKRREYDKIRKEARFIHEDGEVDIYSALTLSSKLRQITSGFILAEGEPTVLDDAKARIQLALSALEDGERPAIIWAVYREELRQLGSELRKAGYRVVEYHGGVGDQEREEAIDLFQAGQADVFLSNPASGGTGITLTAARHVIYYSNDFALVRRLQSEDRSHRRGTVAPVTYTDITARNTVDEVVALALQTKQEVSDLIMSYL